jgi:hypothetical protein
VPPFRKRLPRLQPTNPPGAISDRGRADAGRRVNGLSSPLRKCPTLDCTLFANSCAIYKGIGYNFSRRESCVSQKKPMTPLAMRTHYRRDLQPVALVGLIVDKNTAFKFCASRRAKKRNIEASPTVFFFLTT